MNDDDEKDEEKDSFENNLKEKNNRIQISNDKGTNKINNIDNKYKNDIKEKNKNKSQNINYLINDDNDNDN